MKKVFSVLSVLAILSISSFAFGQGHLLISEFVVTPTEGEFVEIHNPTAVAVDLSKYYLTDDAFQGNNDYIKVVDGTAAPVGSDFLAKFPDGAMIGAGEYKVIAIDGTAFITRYGKTPDFELRGTSGDVPDMVAPKAGNIGATAGLSNEGEMIMLFYWDGTSPTVQDVDYVLWGDKDEAVDKTGVGTYKNDTPKADQKVVKNTTPHVIGKSVVRVSMGETGEKATDGNGILGHDETSEDFTQTFAEGDPTPGMGSVSYVNVTILCNTAAWKDTVGANGVVQIRGTVVTGLPNQDSTPDTLSPGTIIDWNGRSTMFLKNIGGDYWKGTFRIPAGIVMRYKFYVNAAHDTVFAGAEWEHTGWESNIASPGDVYGGNRGLDLTGFTGTALEIPLQFANGWKGQLDDQFETPYTKVDGTFVLWLRVNMLGWEDFDATKHVIGVRGSNMADWGQTGEISWGNTYALTREGTSGTAGAFYSGALHVPNQYATAGVKFKFVVHGTGKPLDEGWGDMVYNPGTEYEVKTTGVDSTVFWKWFDNLKPKQAEHPDEVVVNYVVDLRDAVATRGFVLGDTLQVRAGYGQTAENRYDLYLQRQGVGTIYAGKHTLKTMIGREMFYQYYSILQGREYREIYFNFNFPDKTSNNAERRAFVLTGAEVTIADSLSSIVDSRRMPQFRNVQVIAQDSILVTLTCDARPAIYQVKAGSILDDIQGNVDVADADSVLKWGVAVNGPLSGGWSSPGGDWGRHLMSIANKALNDKGMNGDVVAGDSVFSIQFKMYKGKSSQTNGPDNRIGQEFKFGIGGGDNEGGYGNNHIVNIDDSQPQYTIAAQFGSIDPVFYNAWDFDKRGPVTSVWKNPTATNPTAFDLAQNYPNPFNPSTQIRYQLAKSTPVKLTVFNVLGKEIATLVNQKQQSGSYTVTWDGRDNSGALVGSGVYFYRIEAGDFVKTQKMMFVK